MLQVSPIGFIPKDGALNLQGLKKDVDMHELFDLPSDFWLNECEQVGKFFDEQVGDDLPAAVGNELHQLKDRIFKMQSQIRMKQSAV
jgi:phosphoenolpyruvate carboxykinase (GTP)